MEYSGTVSCKGTLTGTNEREITLEIPVVTSDVQAGVGDHVTAGQILAKVDQEKTLEALSGQNFDLSLFNLSDLLAKYSKTELAAQLTEMASEVMSKLDLSELSLPENIVAPIDGVVVAASASEDMAITPLAPAFVVAPEQGMQAVVLVREVDIAEIRVGQTAELTCTALPGKTYAATVQSIAPSAVQRLSGTTSETFVEVTLSVSQPDTLLKDGYNVRASIQTSDPEQVLLIPYEAVQQNEDGEEYVFLLRQGHAVMQMVEMGECLSDGEVVNAGIRPGDWIIVQPSSVEEDSLVIAKQGEAEG